METKHQVHNLIILDESGSMESIKSSIISGFNELVQTIKSSAALYPEQEHFISFVSFNGMGRKLLHFIDPVELLEKIDDSLYQPNASTPLYDAMGYSLNKLKQITQSLIHFNVLVTILTDGEENSSREYNKTQINSLVIELKKQKWTFTYIGTDHEVEKVAQSLSINNTMRFEKNEESIKMMFEKEKHSRMVYMRKIRHNEETGEDYYG